MTETKETAAVGDATARARRATGEGKRTERQATARGGAGNAGPGFESASRAADAMIKGAVAVQAELVAFADHRVRAGIEAAQSVLGSDSPAEALSRQVDFARRETEAYFAAAAKLLDIAARISQEGLVSLRTESGDTKTRRD